MNLFGAHHCSSELLDCNTDLLGGLAEPRVKSLNSQKHEIPRPNHSIINGHLVTSAIIVGVKELLEPLDKLKIVLETAFDKPVHGHNLKLKKPQLHFHHYWHRNHLFQNWIQHYSPIGPSQEHNTFGFKTIIKTTHFINVHLLEGCLKDFEVLDVLVF